MPAICKSVTLLFKSIIGKGIQKRAQTHFPSLLGKALAKPEVQIKKKQSTPLDKGINNA